MPDTSASSIAAALLPPCTHIVTHDGHTYRFYRAHGNLPDHEFRDPVDGALLITCKNFATMALAQAWVESRGERA